MSWQMRHRNFQFFMAHYSGAPQKYFCGAWALWCATVVVSTYNGFPTSDDTMMAHNNYFIAYKQFSISLTTWR
jgi:hypothetical protein